MIPTEEKRQCGNLDDGTDFAAYHRDDEEASGEPSAAGELLSILNSTLLSENLSNKKALRLVSSLEGRDGGKEAVEELAASAVTLLLAVCIDFEGYRRDVEASMSEMRSIVADERGNGPSKGRPAWVETRPYSEMRAAAEGALSAADAAGIRHESKEKTR